MFSKAVIIFEAFSAAMRQKQFNYSVREGSLPGIATPT